MTTRSPLDVALHSLRHAVRQAEDVLASHTDADLTSQMNAAADVYTARQTLARQVAASGPSTTREGIASALSSLLGAQATHPTDDATPRSDSPPKGIPHAQPRTPRNRHPPPRERDRVPAARVRR